MNEIKLTAAQQLAVDLRKRSILVSAAAGSGKTATLTKRIIALLTDKEAPADIADMLIVTFTRKAAGELKTRITKALTEALAADRSNRHLSRQLTSVGSARICTIDSYYKSIVDANFQRLGISSSFRLSDESELAPMRLSLMNAAIDRAYSVYEDFGAFCDELTTAKSDARLAQTLLDISKKLSAVPDGVKYLNDCAALYEQEANMPFFESRAGKSMLKTCTETLNAYLSRGNAALRLIDENPEAEPRRAALQNDCDTIKSTLEALEGKNYTAAQSCISDYAPIKIGNAKEKNDILKTKTSSMMQKLKNLSGGNQQKVIIARWLLRNSDIFIFDEPTRGIDIGAKSEIYTLMQDLAKKGKSIIMISSELSEITGLSDRVVVMSEGRITGVLSIEDATNESIMRYAMGECNE